MATRTKIGAEEKARVKKSLMALGYLYETSETGERRRKKFFYVRVLFALALMMLFYYFGYVVATGTVGTSLANPATLISAIGLGFVVGFVVGITSVGSGALMTPILLLDFGDVVGKALVVGTATTSGSVEKLIFTAKTYYRKRIKSGYVFIVAITGVPIASIAAFYSSAIISWNLFPPILAVVLILVALRMIGRYRLEQMYTVDPEITPDLRFRGMMVGVVIGLVAGLTGVSTGSLLVSALILIMKYPNRTAVDIALIEGGLILLAATATQLYFGHVNLPFTGVLLVGGVPGILLGGHYKNRINQKVLGYGIAGVIMLEALRTLSQFFFGKSFFIF